ncbi:MAG: preprotein translocase subunit YajC [Nitrospinota bacterium]|nr:preprotein translocase subunit YajC [Nitrospinota bacterium]
MVSYFIGLITGATDAFAMARSGGDEPSLLISLFPFLIVFVIIYFLMIRPQQKKQQDHREMLSALKVGDNVVASGIFGEVTRIKDDVVHVKVADNVRVRFARQSITNLTPKEGGESSQDQSKDKSKD